MAATVPEYSISEFFSKMAAELSWKLPSNPNQPCVFWSLNVGQSSSCIQEKIKSALCNLELEHRRVLIQFWAPMEEVGEGTYLATLDQPFALMEINKNLCDYRKHTLSYKFSVSGERKEGQIGPPGRVFCNKLPESTPDIRYYSTKEYPQRDFAIECGIQESYYLPVFEFCKGSCVGVLEYAYAEGDFAFPCFIEDLNEALEVQNLKLKHLPDSQMMETICGWRRATDELDEILDMVHKTYNLPLAQTWIPYKHSAPEIICTKRLAQYVDDSKGLSISIACDIHQLTKGKLIENTLLSHQPCFCEDVSKLGITEYPLAHYARDDELTTCYVMCLQSTHTGSFDYVLELFLPHDKSNRGDAQTLLDSILKTMKQEFQSFKMSSGEQLGEELSVQVISSFINDKFDVFKICQTARSPPSHEVIIYSEIEGYAKSPLQEDGSIHFENMSPKRASETENNPVEYVEVDDSSAMKNGMDCVCPDNSETSQTTITYPKRKPQKMASKRKKRTPELIISQEGLQEKIGRNLEVAADSSARRPSVKRNCPQQEFLSQTYVRKKKVKVSCSVSNLKQKNDTVKGSIIKVATESSAKEAPHFAPSLNQTVVVAAAADIISNLAPLTIPDPRTVTIKVTYTESIIIKFQLSISAGVAALEEKVIKRLKFKEGSFKCKYEDNNGDLVVIASDEDLQTCFGSLSPNDKFIRLSILPQTRLTI